MGGRAGPSPFPLGASVPCRVKYPSERRALDGGQVLLLTPHVARDTTPRPFQDDEHSLRDCTITVPDWICSPRNPFFVYPEAKIWGTEAPGLRHWVFLKAGQEMDAQGGWASEAPPPVGATAERRLKAPGESSPPFHSGKLPECGRTVTLPYSIG